MLDLTKLPYKIDTLGNSKNIPDTPERVIDFFELLKERAMELVPDYPYEKAGAFDYLHALTSSIQGIIASNDDMHKVIKFLRPDLYEENTNIEERIKKFEQLYRDAGVKADWL